MTLLTRIFYLLLFLISTANAEVMRPSGTEGKKIEELIGQMYSFSTKTFESGEFSGTYDPKRFCELQGNFLDEQLLGLNKRGVCDPSNRIRFPKFDSEEVVADPQHRAPFKAKIESVTVAGNDANAKVNLSKLGGRVVFFLKKTDKGWRITNLLSYEQWPLDLGPEGCHSPGYRFALPPRSVDQLEDLPSACRKLEEWNLKQRGKK